MSPDETSDIKHDLEFIKQQNEEILLILRGPMDHPSEGLISRVETLWADKSARAQNIKRIVGALLSAAGIAIASFFVWVVKDVWTHR
jgi:hypothetical protein